MPIDESLAFKPVRIALLTISDSRSAADDRSGDKLEQLLIGAGHILAARALIRDETDLIVSRLLGWIDDRSEEHTSELQSLMRISYAVFCLKKKKINTITSQYTRRI